MQSLFIGPKNEKPFGQNDPYYVPEPTRWNRALYYEMPNPNLCHIQSLNEFCTINNVNEPLGPIEGISGVWSIWGSKNLIPDVSINDKNMFDLLTCLDVHETLDMGYEIRMHEKDLNIFKEAPWDSDLFTENGLTSFSLAKRGKAISSWCNLTYIIVAKNVSGKINREAIEAQYAWENKAIYWNRNYFQAVTEDMLRNQRSNDYISKLK